MMRPDLFAPGRAQQQAKAAANKEELLEMITHGADKIINSSDQ